MFGASSFPSGSLELGRSALEQECGQDDVGRHLQELALPVLEDRRGEVAAPEILQQPERRATMLYEDGVVRFPSGQAHRHDGEEKEGTERYGESVVAQKCPRTALNRSPGSNG